MHAGMFPWWKSARCAGEDHVGGGRFGGWHAHGGGQGGGEEGGASFGVRRPLRFLAYKLDLSEQQTTELARILDDLKTERAQGSVDDRRAVAAFAEAVGGETFDAAKAAEASKGRTATAERLGQSVTEALSRIHQLLEPEQRQRLAYLVRSGTLSL
jgi:Spy/CpxP family protein refolding chaperone